MNVSISVVASHSLWSEKNRLTKDQISWSLCFIFNRERIAFLEKELEKTMEDKYTLEARIEQKHLQVLVQYMLIIVMWNSHCFLYSYILLTNCWRDKCRMYHASLLCQKYLFNWFCTVTLWINYMYLFPTLFLTPTLLTLSNEKEDSIFKIDAELKKKISKQKFCGFVWQ